MWTRPLHRRVGLAGVDATVQTDETHIPNFDKKILFDKLAKEYE